MDGSLRRTRRIRLVVVSVALVTAALMLAPAAHGWRRINGAAVNEPFQFCRDGVRVDIGDNHGSTRTLEATVGSTLVANATLILGAQPIHFLDENTGQSDHVDFSGAFKVTWLGGELQPGTDVEMSIILTEFGHVELSLIQPVEDCFLFPEPPNDDLANATPISGDSPVATAQKNTNATKELGEPDHAGDPGGRSLWYRWTAPANGRARIDTCDTDFDTLLAVYTGSTVSGLTQVASNEDACGASEGSLVAFDVRQGQEYRIAVDGFDADYGTYALVVGLTRALQCADGLDNDGDSLVDLVDPGCSGPADNDEFNLPPPPRCADGLDNDGDSLVDLADPGCSGPADNDEFNSRPPPRCSDGVDNDGDGRVDRADPGCRSATDNDETGPTDGNDVLTGTARSDRICGLGGSDVISGLGGNDTLFGDRCGAVARAAGGVKSAAAANGNDRVNGGAGNDRLYGSGGADRLSGGSGGDRLYGGPGRDTLVSGPGKDRLDGGSGRDTLLAGGGSDTVNVRDGARDTVNCGPGLDKVRADTKDQVRSCERRG